VRNLQRRWPAFSLQSPVRWAGRRWSVAGGQEPSGQQVGAASAPTRRPRGGVARTAWSLGCAAPVKPVPRPCRGIGFRSPALPMTKPARLFAGVASCKDPALVAPCGHPPAWGKNRWQVLVGGGAEAGMRSHGGNVKSTLHGGCSMTPPGRGPPASQSPSRAGLPPNPPPPPPPHAARAAFSPSQNLEQQQRLLQVECCATIHHSSTQ
jgi:hypothetical protein